MRQIIRITPLTFPSGFVVLAVLVTCFVVRRRRRRTKVRASWVNGVEKPERNLFGFKSSSSVQKKHEQDPHPHPVSSSPVSDAYIPTPYTAHGPGPGLGPDPTSVTSSTGSTFHPLTERPFSAHHHHHQLLSPVVIRRTNKIAELDQARRLAVVGSGVSSSSASPLDVEPHDIPLPLTPNPAAAQRANTAADSSTIPVVTAPTDTAANSQRLRPHDSHPVGLPDEPPPQYDTVV